jgi:signal transduction histidine kinase
VQKQESENSEDVHTLNELRFIQKMNKSMTTQLNKKIHQIEKLNKNLSEQNSKKDDFISIATHELKSPIHPILGFAELAKTGIMSNEEAWEGVVEMATQLQNLIGVILDANHIDRQSLKLSFSDVNLKSIITQKVMISKSSPDCMVPIVSELGDDMIISGDEVRLGEVFQNLLNNSVKFTETGLIKVSGYVDKSNNEVLLRFSDTGKGIPKDVENRIFDKFVTKNSDSQKPGTGLGLFVSKGIIESHGGKIYANNNFLENGATFTIILPISQSDSTI